MTWFNSTAADPVESGRARIVAVTVAVIAGVVLLGYIGVSTGWLTQLYGWLVVRIVRGIIGAAIAFGVLGALKSRGWLDKVRSGPVAIGGFLVGLFLL